MHLGGRFFYLVDLTPESTLKTLNHYVRVHLRWIGNKPIWTEFICWMNERYTQIRCYPFSHNEKHTFYLLRNNCYLWDEKPHDPPYKWFRMCNDVIPINVRLIDPKRASNTMIKSSNLLFQEAVLMPQKLGYAWYCIPPWNMLCYFLICASS